MFDLIKNSKALSTAHSFRQFAKQPQHQAALKDMLSGILCYARSCCWDAFAAETRRPN
jgi:hypothetical protein